MSAWRNKNRKAYNDAISNHRRSHGVKPMSENKECALFLGVHVAEKVLSKVFKDVEVMPFGNPGYDFICNKGKKIDVKSSCAHISCNGVSRWQFHTVKNAVADYFLCIAFDNRHDLNPLHVWLIPSNSCNNSMCRSISETTIDKYDEYRLNIDNVITCCNKIKDGF